MASVGGVVSGISVLTAGDYCTIQPGAGEEWIIHNIYFDQKAVFFFYDGSNRLNWDFLSDRGLKPWMVFHLTNSRYLQVQAQDMGTTLVGWDGIRVK